MSAQELGQNGHDPDKGSYRFTNCFQVEPGTTPEKVMAIMQRDPQAVFPFPIDAEGSDEIELGREYSLRPIFLDSEEVTVNEQTSTSFGFVAEEDHLRGEGATLRFRTYQNEKGEVCLEQTATYDINIFSPLLDLGSGVMWRIQSIRLQNLLREQTQESDGE